MSKLCNYSCWSQRGWELGTKKIVAVGAACSILVTSRFSPKTMYNFHVKGIRCAWQKMHSKSITTWKEVGVCSLQLVAAAAMAAMVGCSSPARVAAPPHARSNAVQEAVSVERGKPAKNQVPSHDIESAPLETKRSGQTTARTPPEVPLPAGQFMIKIESLPSDAMIVINGVPSGRTPLKFLLAGTPQGFAREPTLIKVRFLAMLPGERSVTVEDQLTPLDRIPSGMIFTPEGAQRRW